MELYVRKNEELSLRARTIALDHFAAFLHNLSNLSRFLVDLFQGFDGESGAFGLVPVFQDDERRVTRGPVGCTSPSHWSNLGHPPAPLQFNVEGFEPFVALGARPNDQCFLGHRTWWEVLRTLRCE